MASGWPEHRYRPGGADGVLRWTVRRVLARDMGRIEVLLEQMRGEEQRLLTLRQRASAVRADVTQRLIW
jgi:hypothetical protein